MLWHGFQIHHPDYLRHTAGTPLDAKFKYSEVNEKDKGTKYTITMLGNSFVGKSSLTIRFATGYFVEEYDSCFEDDYRKMIYLDVAKRDYDNANCKGSNRVYLDIFDTAGQKEFRSMQDQWMWEGQ